MSLTELLRATSRTFAIGIELLEPPLRQQVQVAYLLLRVSDYLEDNPDMAPGRKVELLRRWSKVLEGKARIEEFVDSLGSVNTAMPDALAARRSEEVYLELQELADAQRRVIVAHVTRSTLGMARWVEHGPRFASEADLDDYMHEVAGRVGYLLTDLFALHSEDIAARRVAMSDLGREFGLALQTVNVIRGLHADRFRGWIFIPESYVEGSGLAPAELFEPGNRSAALAVLDRLVAKAERHLDAARRYIRQIPRRHRSIRLFCMLPLLFAVRTLAISRADARVFRQEMKIGRTEVRRIVRNASIFGFSNLWLDWYCERLGRRGPGG